MEQTSSDTVIPHPSVEKKMTRNAAVRVDLLFSVDVCIMVNIQYISNQFTMIVLAA